MTSGPPAAEHAAPAALVWVPDEVCRYLAHVEARQSIRDIARSVGCHASTVMRQIRRLETRRDDTLIDAALTRLARTMDCAGDPQSPASVRSAETMKDILAMSARKTAAPDVIETAVLNREALRVLRRLCETGAVLAVAENMEKSVVVRDDEGGNSLRTAVVDTPVAEAMALKDWIACAKPGRISRYRITAAGRTALSRLLAEQENRKRSASETGFAEAAERFADPGGDWQADGAGEAGARKRTRYSVAESPMVALARRKDRDGRPFLDDSLVQAGERLREDFELSQIGPRVGQNWDHFLTGGSRADHAREAPLDRGPGASRDRVARALADLGPGLSDVVLRCCCYLEGLEMIEQKMGWSARSGKIVLRIALQRLKRHYEGQSDRDRMIG